MRCICCGSPKILSGKTGNHTSAMLLYGSLVSYDICRMSLEATAINCGEVLDDSRNVSAGKLPKTACRKGLRMKPVFPL